MNYRKRKSSHVVFLIALLFLGACTGQTKTKEGQPMSSDKLLPMEGGYNIRDLGGIETADGRCVKSGLIFRGDELGGLTAKDWEFLSSLWLISEAMKKWKRIPIICLNQYIIRFFCPFLPET